MPSPSSLLIIVIACRLMESCWLRGNRKCVCSDQMICPWTPPGWQESLSPQRCVTACYNHCLAAQRDTKEKHDMLISERHLVLFCLRSTPLWTTNPKSAGGALVRHSRWAVESCNGAKHTAEPGVSVQRNTTCYAVNRSLMWQHNNRVSDLVSGICKVRCLLRAQNDNTSEPLLSSGCEPPELILLTPPWIITSVKKVMFSPLSGYLLVSYLVVWIVSTITQKYLSVFP